MRRKISIIGAGAWGIALAQHFARRGNDVTLWSRRALPDQERRLPRLPDVTLNDALTVTRSFPQDGTYTIFSTPTAYLRDTAALYKGKGYVIGCCKGLEPVTDAFPSMILEEMCHTQNVAILSGPNFAREIAIELPGAATIAAKNQKTAEHVATELSTSVFRLYATDDLRGVELAGAAKNVIAIAAGVAIGAGLGENARAALITRGLAELARLNEALGGRAETMQSLSCVGDLILTCTGHSSRNFNFGIALGQSANIHLIRFDEKNGVVEGRRTAPVLLDLAQKHGVDTPIIRAVTELIKGQCSVGAAQEALLSRRPVRE